MRDPLRLKEWSVLFCCTLLVFSAAAFAFPDPPANSPKA